MAKPVIPEAPLVNIIGKNTIIEGKISCKGDIRIEGQVKGSIDCAGKLVIGDTGTIEGDLICQNGDFSGVVKGQIRVSEMLILKSTCQLEGDIECSKLAIEPGARFSGKCTMDLSAKTTEMNL